MEVTKAQTRSKRQTEPPPAPPSPGPRPPRPPPPRLQERRTQDGGSTLNPQQREDAPTRGTLAHKEEVSKPPGS
jgi:hypothetical protein